MNSSLVRKTKLVPSFLRTKLEKLVFLWKGLFALWPKLENRGLYIASILGLLKNNRIYTYDYKNGMRISFRAGTHDTQIHVEVIGNDTYSKRIVGDIRKMSRCVDLGAQTGVFTLHLLFKNKNLRIVSVEAVAENLALARKNIEQNGFLRQVQILHRAAWGKSGDTLVMNISSVNSGGHSAVRSGHGYTDGGTVETISLKDIVDGQSVDLLKLDIEGSEYEVLNNADKETLSRIAEIIMELHGSPEQNDALARHLSHNGFILRREAGYMSAVKK